MKKVLILTYYWPPSGGAGVQRWLKFAKFLRQFGWEPIVLTIKDGTYPTIDNSLEKEIPDRVKVFKVCVFEPFQIFNFLRGQKEKTVSSGLTDFSANSFFQKIFLYIRANFFIPDARKKWVSPAASKAIEIINKEKISILVTTGPPHSTHLAGLKIKKMTNIPWLADMRDPWTGVFYNKFLPRTKMTQRKDQFFENQVLEKADIITVVSKGLKNEFQDRANKIKRVYNGFDSDDFQFPKLVKSKKFNLSYVGNLKPSQNPDSLWKAAAQLKSEIKDLNKTFVINFIGNVDSSILNSIESYNIQDIVTVTGFVSHQEATRLMQNSNQLLFVVPNVEDNSLIITGKLFEYLASLSPILSIGPIEGDASDILEISNRSKMLDYKDVKGVINCLKKEYLEWLKTGKLKKCNSENIEQFSRKSLTKKMGELFDSLL